MGLGAHFLPPTGLGTTEPLPGLGEPGRGPASAASPDPPFGWEPGCLLPAQRSLTVSLLAVSPTPARGPPRPGPLVVGVPTLHPTPPPLDGARHTVGARQAAVDGVRAHVLHRTAAWFRVGSVGPLGLRPLQLLKREPGGRLLSVSVGGVPPDAEPLGQVHCAGRGGRPGGRER